MKTRHKDDGTTIHDFTDRFLVACPKCSSCAQVIRSDPDPGVHPWSAKFSCIKCGRTELGKLGGWSDRDPVDWVFGYALWLQTSCCRQILWAYNFKHLSLLESYVSAVHRAGMTDAQAIEKGVRNSTLASSLPSWMISSKNRGSVLKAIQTIRAEHAT
jgi:hypothetical protein